MRSESSPSMQSVLDSSVVVGRVPLSEKVFLQHQGSSSQSKSRDTRQNLRRGLNGEVPPPVRSKNCLNARIKPELYPFSRDYVTSLSLLFCCRAKSSHLFVIFFGNFALPPLVADFTHYLSDIRLFSRGLNFCFRHPAKFEVPTKVSLY